jgi:hypothetical protein
MKNITLSAEEHLLRQARQRAEAENTTLNNEFRRWLAQYAEGVRTESDYLSLMNRFKYCRPGRTFTREEMNER